MADVTELRVALTVEDFDQALAFYRDALGLEQVADWSSESGRVVGEVRAGARQWVETTPEIYRELARRHAAGTRPVTDPRTR